MPHFLDIGKDISDLTGPGRAFKHEPAGNT